MNVQKFQEEASAAIASNTLESLLFFVTDWVPIVSNEVLRLQNLNELLQLQLSELESNEN